MNDSLLGYDISKFICQIFQINDGWAESIGSGIFISFPIKGMEHCLMTAAHVTETSELAIASSLSYDSNPQYNLLQNTDYVSQEHDWAIFSFSDDLAKDVVESGKMFYDIKIAETYPPYAFFGFPCSKNKSKSNLVKCRPYIYRGSEISKEEYARFKINPRYCIAVNFKREDVENVKTKEKMTFPDPQGMSGGPIFDTNGLLSGIVTNYERKFDIMYGTKFLTIVSDLLKILEKNKAIV